MNELYLGGSPYAHQAAAVSETWKRPFWGLFCEMGTGKSYIAIMTMINLWLSGQADTFLYVAKKGELSNFQVYELEKWWPKTIPRMQYIYEGYTKADHLKKIKAILKGGVPFPRIMSINIESLRSERPYMLAENFVRSSRKTMVILDECTTIKDPKSSQTKAMMQLRKYCKYARIMTGTVMPHSPVDVWSQTEFLDKGVLGYRSKTAFKADFHEQELVFMGQRRYMQTLGPKNIPLLREKLRSVATVLMKKDCLDLPEKVYSRKLVKLTPEQVRYYTEFVNYSVAQLPEGDYVEAVNALAVQNKLHQIICGQLRDNEGRYHAIDTHRPAATYDLVDEALSSGTEKKVIVWSHYVAATSRLVDFLLERRLGVIHMPGGLTIEDRAARIESFKTDPNKQVWVANPASSGFGLTLTESHTVIYYSNSDNYEHRLQSEDRTHRIGQNNPCLYIDLHTPGTVEDAILKRTMGKAETRLAVMSKEEFVASIQLKEDFELLEDF